MKKFGYRVARRERHGKVFYYVEKYDVATKKMLEDMCPDHAGYLNRDDAVYLKGRCEGKSIGWM